MRKVFSFVYLFTLFLFSMTALATRPNPNLTPGVLCTPQDPNFKGYSYPSHVARCDRAVDEQEKMAIAAEYGNIPKSAWPNFEFDHLIPLCAGGSDNIKNLWPQPIAEAHEKDKVEDFVCRGLQSGQMTQADALQQIKAWILAH